jgi:hypothetical protein
MKVVETDLLQRVRGNVTKGLSKMVSFPLLALVRSLTKPAQAGSLKKVQTHRGASDRAGLK